ncbi:MAG TPA: DNA polymerase [Candidatus Saccharimonadales bacterium]|nr:DNA polymerase [Candidatus Saccharimonadales bacterium]
MIQAVWDSKSLNNFETNFDCYIAEALLSEGRSIGTEEKALEKYKVTNLTVLAEKQQEKFKEYPKLASLFYEIEMPMAHILWKMERKGILLDTQQLKVVGEDIDKKIAATQEEITKETGGGININSPIQLGQFLFEKIGVPLGKTKTGRYATNEAELSRFANQFPIIAHLLTYRELSKLRSTYVESLIQKVDEHDRIHTTYSQVTVNTGRLSSSNPNLQNIPVSSTIGLEIKSCFIASPGKTLVSFDYSQQELRILAHLTGETALIQAFTEERDVHSLTASKLFAVSYESVSPQQRAVGKTINFGIIYGMSSYGMSSGLNIPQEHAEQFIQQFYATYPSIKQYYDNYLKEARVHGVVETLLGRRRYVFEDPRRKFIDNGTRRILMNYPIQGSAADLMKKAMVDVEKHILTKYPDVSLLLQIHDDLVFEIPTDDTEKFKKIIAEIKHTLCNVYPLSVPLVVDVKTGTRWGAMEKYEKM